MAERLVDFAAAGRVASRVELKTIRVTHLLAKCDPKIMGALEPALDLNCTVASRENNSLEIVCNYRFTARVAESEVVDAEIRYLLVYEVKGTESLADQDISEFAVANGTLHSWPFVREFLFGLTSRMGFPPYTVPVFHFKPKPQEKKEAAEAPPATK